MMSPLSHRMLNLALLGVVSCTTAAIGAHKILQPVQAIPLPTVKGGFDYMAVDLAGHRLFVNAEDNDTMEVIDLKQGALVHTIDGMKEPKRIAFRPELRKLYIANGNGNVRVLGSTSYEPRETIEFKQKANNLRYDAHTAERFVGVGDTFGAIAIVDTKTDKPLAQIPLANFPKQFELDGELVT
jgi:DNA-binding beta-propeller fold protein YncE